MPSGDAIERLAAELRDAERAVALTGAGVSAASGVPTFRGDDGVWGDVFSPTDFHVSRFERDPAGFWEDRLELYDHLEPAGGGHRDGDRTSRDERPRYLSSM